MTSQPTPEQLRKFAAKLVREAHEDYDFMGIGEQMSDVAELRDLDEEPFSEVQSRISDLISSAIVTVSWPDEQPQDDGDVRAVAYPGKPGDIWQDCDGDHWILGGDGNLHLVREMTDPYDPAVIEECYAPMALDARDAKGGEVR